MMNNGFKDKSAIIVISDCNFFLRAVESIQDSLSFSNSGLKLIIRRRFNDLGDIDISEIKRIIIFKTVAEISKNERDRINNISEYSKGVDFIFFVPGRFRLASDFINILDNIYVIPIAQKDVTFLVSVLEGFKMLSELSLINGILYSLTPRQLEVVYMYLSGFTDKQIAFILSAEYKTIVTHKTNVMKRVHLFSIVNFIELLEIESVFSNKNILISNGLDFSRFLS
ncbi:LuxR family transcriptional regulator [Erwinia sp. INIA-01]|uniref:helix-turn-helix transcriptional regulator n=1 Tax=Erwinia sp. INIA01 TaxID=2991500 RepID=UPI0022240704|nr:LuxR family transcriptional regulator [Erwinia sp. INIA01]MCW1877226.1 LuxR family transcriptional regulator [Erwinia sp. INIA01]